MIRHIRFTAIALMGVGAALLMTISIQAGDVPVPVPIPPQALTYRVTSAGAVLTWWQASNADGLIIINECDGWGTGTPRHEVVAVEAGQPGWHTRTILHVRDTLHSCLRLNEFYGGNRLGSYGLYPLDPWRQYLPSAGR